MFVHRALACLLCALSLASCTFDGVGMSLADGPAVQRDVIALGDQAVADGQVQPPADAPSWDAGALDAPTPDTPTPDTHPPDTLQPDTLEPDTLQPDTLQPDILQPDILQPDTFHPDTGLPPNTAGCADGTDEQLFAQGMRGCAGKVVLAQRATLCGSGFRVCTAQEWIARRNGIAPQFNYWIDDLLNRYWGSGSGDCAALTSGGGSCGTGSTPMRICASYSDPLGNECNWIKCGIGSDKANLYFGGCQGNKTAGALCCPL